MRMVIDKSFAHMWSLIKTLFLMMTKKEFIGAQCAVKPQRSYGSYEGYENLYVSFSPKPERGFFDDHGVPLEDVFTHLTDVKELLHYMTHRHTHGWYIHSAQLVTLPM